MYLHCNLHKDGKTFAILYRIYWYHKFTSSVYKMNHLSVPTPILSDTIQNIVDIICITNTRYQKWKDNVKEKFTFIDRCKDSCFDNKQQYDCSVVALCNQYDCFMVHEWMNHNIFMAYTITLTFIIQYWRHWHFKKFSCDKLIGIFTNYVRKKHPVW